MPFWQLTLPASADSEDALTNFLWELGALGVVEEEIPGVPPRLRAFFAESMSSTRLLAAVQDYQASLRFLRLAVGSHPTAITPPLDQASASALPPSLPGR